MEIFQTNPLSENDMRLVHIDDLLGPRSCFSWIHSEKRFIYVKIPKAGGSTMMKILGLKYPERFFHPIDTGDFFVFTMIRNPIDRFFSAFNELCKREYAVTKKAAFYAQKTRDDQARALIEELYVGLHKSPYHFDTHIRPQTWFLSYDNGQMYKLDKIYLMENYTAALADLKERGYIAPSQELLHLNASKYPKTSLESRYVDLLEEIYKEDIELYNSVSSLQSTPCIVESGQVERAVSIASTSPKRSTKISETIPANRHDRIEYYFHTDRLELVEQECSQCLKENQQDVFACYSYGRLLLIQNRIADAQIYFHAAFQQAPSSPEMRFHYHLVFQLSDNPSVFGAYLMNHIDDVITVIQSRLLEKYPVILLKQLIKVGGAIANEHKGNWKILWFIALIAAKIKESELVDSLCRMILSLNPEFWFARELPKHIRGYYAQMGQDTFIEQYFNEHKPGSETFLEVGAFDGRHYSNVRRLVEKYNWQGLSVEPVSKNYQKLSRSYFGKNVKCIQAAASNYTGTAEINVSTYPHLPEWGSDVASLDPKENERWTQKYGAKWEKQTVHVKTLTEILSENNLQEIGLLSVDAEGHDLEVLQGLDFSKFKPELIVVEYGDKREEIFDFLAKKGYQLEKDNGQDLFMSCRPLNLLDIEHRADNPSLQFTFQSADDIGIAQSIEECSVEKVRSRINPHLFNINYLPQQETVKIRTINPLQLINHRRFDVLAKIIYGRFHCLNLQSKWARGLYLGHIKAFNNFKESDGTGKTSPDAFIDAFNELSQSFMNEGFNRQKSLIPIGNDNNIIDGSHRLALGYLLNKPVDVAVFNRETNSYDYDYFLRRGLDPKYADAMAYEYARIKKNTHIITVFPSAQGKDADLIEIIRRYADVVYRKNIQLQNNGPHLLIKQMYRGESWLGDWSNQFKGAKHKADQCFRGDGPVRVFLIETDRPEILRQCKEEIRALYKIQNHSVHINDSCEETIRLAQIFFNANSIHFLNHAQLNHYEAFYKLLDEYEKLLDTHRVVKDCFCVDGSASMAVYGIRAARDIDYFHYGYNDVKYHNEAQIGSHNEEIKYHTTTIDDIIFNPDNHFYYEGMKFVSLDILSAMKSGRGEKKDIKDVKLMSPYLQRPLAAKVSEIQPKQNKIVGLVAARNEENIIGQCIRLLSNFTDAIVYLDDCSTDNSLSIVQQLAQQCCVERILTKDQWYRDEPGDRNRALQAGREIGGTHFIFLDADEAFTSNLLINDTLRKMILSLKPGDKLLFNWITLWKSTQQYRHDNSIWANNYKPFVFCDDGKCSYSSDFIHTPRVPGNLNGQTFKIEGYDCGLLHFQFVNWPNLLLKQAWYRCLERIREPQKPIKQINKRYAPSKDETDIHLEPSKPDWFRHYSQFDPAVFEQGDNWRHSQIQNWFKEYGVDFFKDLDIWDIIQPEPIEQNPANNHQMLVSAIVSTYNSEEFIRGCLQDLVEQTLFQKGQLEIVVINSASEQNEDAIIREYVSRYPNIRYIKTEQREGIYAAWNRGIQASGGKYITNANTDDRHAPEMLEKLAMMLEADPDAAGVYSHFYVTDQPNQTWQTKTPIRITDWPPPFSHEALLKACFTGPQPMWRRSLHEEYGWFDESLKVAGDYEFFLRISQTHRLLLNKELLGLYYCSANTLQRSAGTWKMEDDWIKRLYAENRDKKIRCPFDPSKDVTFTPATYEQKKELLRKPLEHFNRARNQHALGNRVAAQWESEKYKAIMDYGLLEAIRSDTSRDKPLFSVIIVTCNRAGKIEKCIQSLRQQDFSDYEILVVDNGDSDKKVSALAGNVDVYVNCPINFDSSEARNIGAYFAEGQILVFLHDDALAAPDYLKSIRRAFETYDILGLRGRIMPVNPGQGIERAIAYDLGEKPFSCISNNQSNNAFRRDAYLAAGGMDAMLSGNEDSDLSIRLIRWFNRSAAVIYWPEAVTYHDYPDAKSFSAKKSRYVEDWSYIHYKYDADVYSMKLHTEQTPLKENQSGLLLPPLPSIQRTATSEHPIQCPAVAGPKVSVIMACHNAADFLGQTLNSICKQTLKEWELLVIDDGSTDQTPDILKIYAAKDSRIRVWSFDDQKGPYVRRNFAISQARADFISIQDADDIMIPHKLKMLYEEICRDDKLSIVGSFYRRFLDVFPGSGFGDPKIKCVTHEELMRNFLRSWHLCWHGSAIIRKTLFQTIGLYDEQPYGSDTFWLAKAGLYGLLTGAVRFKNLPEYLTWKREHSGSQTGKIDPCDPRSRRHRLESYYIQKLRQIYEYAQKTPSLDVAAALRQCTCTDFIPQFGHLFEKWESAPITQEIIQGMIQKILMQFSSEAYVSSLITLNALEKMVPGIMERKNDLNFTRALAYYACGHDKRAIECIQKIIVAHQHPMAQEFYTRYMQNLSESRDAAQRRANINAFMEEKSILKKENSQPDYNQENRINAIQNQEKAGIQSLKYEDLQAQLETAKMCLKQGKIEHAAKIYNGLLSNNIVQQNTDLRQKIQELVTKVKEDQTVSVI